MHLCMHAGTDLVSRTGGFESPSYISPQRPLSNDSLSPPWRPSLHGADNIRLPLSACSPSFITASCGGALHAISPGAACFVILPQSAGRLGLDSMTSMLPLSLPRTPSRQTARLSLDDVLPRGFLTASARQQKRYSPSYSACSTSMEAVNRHR